MPIIKDSENDVLAKRKPASGDETGANCGEKDDKLFDPYDYGMEDGFGVWGAVVHIVRITFGAGILLLPYTMKSVGYVTGAGLLLLVSLFYYHNMHILIGHEYKLCKQLNLKHITYASLAKKTFENAPFPYNHFGVFVGRLMFVYFCLATYNSTYLLVLAGSVQYLAKHLGLQAEIGGIMAASVIPLTLFCMFKRSLKILVPFSALTNFFSLLMAVVLLACCAIYRKSDVTIRPFGDPNLIPQTFALYIQAFICTCSILPVKNYMRQPRRLQGAFGALNISAAILTFLFANFALVSYFCYGDQVEENILSNLPSGHVLSFVVHLLYAFAMFVIYLLSFSVIFDNVWPEMEARIADTKLKCAAEYGLRVGLNAWSYLLVVCVPNLALVLTVSGTFAIVLEVGLIPFLDLTLALRNKEKSFVTIFKDLAIIAVSAALFYLSLVDCVNEIRRLYTK